MIEAFAAANNYTVETTPFIDNGGKLIARVAVKGNPLNDHWYEWHRDTQDWRYACVAH